MHIQQLYNVWMVAKFFKEHYFSEGSLGVSSVSKCIEDLLDSDHRSCPTVRGFPDNAVGALSESPPDLVLLSDVGVNVCGRLVVGHLQKRK